MAERTTSRRPRRARCRILPRPSPIAQVDDRRSMTGLHEFAALTSPWWPALHPISDQLPLALDPSRVHTGRLERRPLSSGAGEGMDATFLPRVFQPFWQADASSSRRHGGVGLGLAIAKEIVQAHGGTISAASAGPGLGTTFTFELPRWLRDASTRLQGVARSPTLHSVRRRRGGFLFPGRPSWDASMAQRDVPPVKCPTSMSPRGWHSPRRPRVNSCS